MDRSSMTGQQGIQMHQQLPVNKCTCKVALENSRYLCVFEQITNRRTIIVRKLLTALHRRRFVLVYTSCLTFPLCH